MSKPGILCKNTIGKGSRPHKKSHKVMDIFRTGAGGGSTPFHSFWFFPHYKADSNTNKLTIK